MNTEEAPASKILWFNFTLPKTPPANDTSLMPVISIQCFTYAATVSSKTRWNAAERSSLEYFCVNDLTQPRLPIMAEDLIVPFSNHISFLILAYAGLF